MSLSTSSAPCARQAIEAAAHHSGHDPRDGVRVILPSELTPHVNTVVALVIAQGFDASEVTLVEGAAATAARLLTLPFDHLVLHRLARRRQARDGRGGEEPGLGKA